MSISVVVLAGGRSTRFGADKLSAQLGLLDTLLDGVSPDYRCVVVGTDRELPRRAGVRVVADEVAAGGPAAGLLTGLRWCVADSAQGPAVVLPGDAPGGGLVIEPLLAALSAGAAAAWARGSSGPQPLPVALSPAAAARLLSESTVTSGAGRSVRSLLTPLAPVTVTVDPAGLYDVDTPLDLDGWHQRRHPLVLRTATAVRALVDERPPGAPLVVALSAPDLTPECTEVLAASLRVHLSAEVVRVGEPSGRRGPGGSRLTIVTGLPIGQIRFAGVEVVRLEVRAGDVPS